MRVRCACCSRHPARSRSGACIVAIRLERAWYQRGVRVHVVFVVIALANCRGSEPATAVPATPVPTHASDGPAAPLVELLHQPGAKVAVSSVVANPKLHARDLVDGKLATAWNSRTGDLQGAWIEVRVPRDARIQRMRMTAGFTATGAEGDYFTMNPRVREVRVVRNGADGDYGHFTLDTSSRALQDLAIDTSGGDLRIEITGVVPGTRKTWREVCVSELEVWGTLPGGASEPLPPDVVVGSLDASPNEAAPADPCETVASHEISGGSVAIVVCEVSRFEHRPGWIEVTKRGELVGPGGMRADLGSWTDGWEWGALWSIDNVLVAGNKTALLVKHTLHSAGDQTVWLSAFVRHGDSWERHELDSSERDLEIIATTDPAVAVVGDGKRTYHLRFDGDAVRVIDDP